MATVKGFLERNDRTDNRRPLNETYLVMEGGTCEVIDVSMGGISFAGTKEKFPLGKDIVVKGVRVEDEEMVELGAHAEVVRSVSRASGGIGLKFHKLSSLQFGIVEALVINRPLVPKKKKPAKKKKKKVFGLGVFN
jgi:hypothetical protein